jgi:hypothetical protein
MAADAFNSVGGYTIGIPPVPFIDANGNLTVNEATIGNVTITGNQVVTGNIVANYFVGSFSGNISGNLTAPGESGWILFNEVGQAAADQNLVYDSANAQLIVTGTVVANSYVVGTGSSEFSTTSTLFATTFSNVAGQVLHSQLASNICSVDYTIIATDTTANTRQTSKLFASVLGTEVGFYEYGTIDVPQSSAGVADFSVTYDSPSGNVNLTVAPMASDTITYKIMVISYKE